jgi:HSP20 family molecular chaperone IbpA
MTTLRLRNTWVSPFAELDAFLRPLATDVARTGFTPAADIARDGEDALVSVELPGLDPEKDVTVEVDGGALVIRGERRDERDAEQNGRRLHEVRYGSFRRTFTLPAHVTGSDLTATYDKGVLTVRVAGAYRGTTTHRVPVTAGTTQAVAGATQSE